jgi:uncharacterized protein
MWTIVLLTISNIFMTFAWYGHLKFRQDALWKVILVSWGIAFFEYCFQVPANRIGYERFSPVQLKVIQEVITLVVFGVFVTYYFGEHLRWNHASRCALPGGRGLLRISHRVSWFQQHRSAPVLFEILLHLKRGHAAGAGRGNRLAVAPVLHVAAGKTRLEQRRRCA